MIRETTQKTAILSLAMLIAGVAGCGSETMTQGDSVGVAGEGASLKDSDRDGHDDYDDAWRLFGGDKHNKNKCPVVQAFATPPVLKVGQTTQLRGFAVDPDNRPRRLTYNWTVSPATTGTISNPTSKRSTFKCLQPGVAHVTFLSSDGDCVRKVNLNVYCKGTVQTSCGDGAKNGTETCDSSSPNAADKCPTTCVGSDTNACTTDVLTGTAAACNVQCTHTPVTTCANSDTCCPSGCKNPQDNDCAPSCGDGAKNGTETCDNSSADKCPTVASCNDNIACTTDTVSGSATMCNAVCGHTAITVCVSGDGCCAPGCTGANDNDCAPVCGDGAKNGLEKCDNSSPVAADKCPTSCADTDACTTDSLIGSATDCSAMCGHAAVTACVADGCCPSGCKNPANGGTDVDCAVAAGCNNGRKDAGETCDNSSPNAADKCPTSCTDTNTCTTDVLAGDPNQCNVTCGHNPITTCNPTTVDGCCASGCTSTTDKDCTPSCGDGAKNGSETCDNSSSVPADKCPASCSDGDSCTTDVPSGNAAQCSATCGHTAIMACVSGDGCCAPGCANTLDGGTDNDCVHTPKCGDGIVDTALGETCDGNCPTTCNDGKSCTTDTLTGQANQCNVVCRNTGITACLATSDTCCPAGCNANNDGDCMPVCNNTVKEAGETCDPLTSCPTSCNDSNACTKDTLSGDPTLCTSTCTFATISACVSGDGCCPQNCANPANGGTDSDCTVTVACGNGRKDGTETCDNSSPNAADRCPTTCNDNNGCTLDVQAGDFSHCNVVCSHSAISVCTGATGDSCCPGNSHAVGNACNANNDIDCISFCGNGVKESPELCDGADCATAASCNDNDPCTIDTVTGSVATCDAVCTHTASTTPACLCGNGHLDGAEKCDGNCPTVTTCNDSNPCTIDSLTGSASTCDAVCVHTDSTTPACLCGNGRVDSGETCDGNCPTPASCPVGTDSCNPKVFSGSAATCSAVCATAPVLTCGPVTAPPDGCCLKTANGGPVDCTNANDVDCTVTRTVCQSCEHTQHGTNNCPSAAANCDNLQGVTGGTLAPGLSKALLCNQVLDCIHASKCASNFNDTDCLCGTDVPSGDCFAGTFAAMTGACRDIMAQAAETNVPAQLSLRFSDATYAVGAAITLVENCDYTECLNECLFN